MPQQSRDTIVPEPGRQPGGPNCSGSKKRSTNPTMVINQDGIDGEADRISALPDELLHDILIHLRDTTEAARTSVLSRRWCRVWCGLPELFFLDNMVQAPAATAHDCVDTALAAWSAPTIRRLEIRMPCDKSPQVPSGRVTGWLRFVSQHLSGVLRLSLPFDPAREEEEVLLPPCERLTDLTVHILRVLRFQLPPAGGTFTALTALRIGSTHVDGGELERFVSTCCPKLKVLILDCIIIKDKDRVVLSIQSSSLERLRTNIIFGGAGRLHVDAPELQAFCQRSLCDFYISSPKLSEVIWYDSCYDPNLHKFAAAGRRLRRLETDVGPSSLPLMQRFNTVDELFVEVNVDEGAEEYMLFLHNLSKLPKCQVLVVRSSWIDHAFNPTMLYIIKNCVGIRKLVLLPNWTKDDFQCTSPGCPCGLPEQTSNDVVLDSLEEVEVRNYGEADHTVELVKLLCDCSAMFLKRVTITVSKCGQSSNMREKIHSIILPENSKVEIIV